MERSLSELPEITPHRSGALSDRIFDKFTRPSNRLYIIFNIDESSLSGAKIDAYLARLEAILAGGATLIQLRAKALGPGDLLEFARRAAQLTRPANAILLINGRASGALDASVDPSADAREFAEECAKIARISGAQGLHRPAKGPDLRVLRGFLSKNGPKTAQNDDFNRLSAKFGILSTSTHHESELRAAAEQGADFVTLSPIFLTSSKPGYGPALGLDTLKRLNQKLRADKIALPIYALGGITPERAAACLDAGAHGVAVMGGVMRAANPAKIVEQYLDALAGV